MERNSNPEMPGVSLTIDGQGLTVEQGTTLLEAARRVGVTIPTLCHLEGFEPAASCFLCAVQVQGKATLSPSCATPAAEGMVVSTNSDDIRAARKMAVELLLSDHAGDCVSPCSARCPAGLNIPGFLFEIVNDQPHRSMDIIAERLALAGSLGRICPRLCEDACRRTEGDGGLAIAELHRYVADRHCAADSAYVPACHAPTGKSVAIIGAGPAGLAAAWFLLQRGHACTLFDAHLEPGGMLRYGIPAYRLPREALDAEVDVLRRMGASFKMGVRWGEDFSLGELRRAHDAVFIAIGAQRAAPLGCEGETLAMSGLELLHRVACGERPNLGANVVVVGGGNTAMDASRTAIRLGSQRVSILYRRTRQEMPCLLDEVEEAEAEGCHIEFLAAPVRIEREGTDTLRVTCQRMQLGEPDASGRRRPVPIPGSEFLISASVVIAAVGQSVDLSPAKQDGLACTMWGIAADRRTLATGLPGVFAGGDGVSGADLAVRAVAAGQTAAASIDQYLTNRAIAGPETPVNVAIRGMDEGEMAELLRSVERRPRVATPQLDLSRRCSTFCEIGGALPQADAQREAARCVNCGCTKTETCRMRQLATEYGADPYRFGGERRRFTRDASHPEIIYEPGKCIMCEACVRIAERAREPLGLAVIGRGFQVTIAAPFNSSMSDALHETAMQCAEVCPTGAIALRSLRCCDFVDAES